MLAMGYVPCSSKDQEDAGKGLLLFRAVWLRGELWPWAAAAPESIGRRPACADTAVHCGPQFLPATVRPSGRAMRAFLLQQHGNNFLPSQDARSSGSATFPPAWRSPPDKRRDGIASRLHNPFAAAH